jgi:hypothetical protein
MKNKLLVLDRVEKIRYKVNNLKYLVNTNGSFDDIGEAFNEIFEVVDNMENLVSIEEDPFRSNQII